MFNLRRHQEITCFCVVVFILIQINLVYPESVDASTSVLAGEDRYRTAVAISQKGWKESDYVVLVRGDDFADAICAGPLAAKHSAPLLFTGQHTLNAYTLEEIRRLGAKNVIIVGGYNAIYGYIEGELNAAGIKSANIERIYGANRYETSVEVAKRLGSKEVAIVIGDQYTDALSISAVAAAKGFSILLTSKDSLPDAVRKHLANYKIEKSYIIGGTGVITENVELQVPAPIRLAGENRYDTNRVILEHFASELDFNKIYIATGEGKDGYADSLAGVVLAAKSFSPIVLNGKTIPAGTRELIRTKMTVASNIIALGGEAAVPSAVLSEYRQELSDILKSVFSQKGTYGPDTGTTTISGSLAIEAPNILVQNTVIEGDLLLGERIGYGQVELRNVTVKGRTTIRGGGENGIIGDIFTAKSVVVDLANDREIAFRLRGKSKVENVRVETSILLDDSENTGDGFMAVNIVKGREVTLRGTYNNANVSANGVILRMNTATLKTLNARVKQYVHGTGTIATANIGSNGVEISFSPAVTNVEKGYTAYVAGQRLTEGTTKYTPPPTPKPVPTPINNLAGTAGNEQVQLTFSAPTGATSVVLRQSINGGSTWSTVPAVTLNASSTSAVVTGLLNDQRYHYKLVVTGGSKAGESNIVTLMPIAPIPL